MTVACSLLARLPDRSLSCGGNDIVMPAAHREEVPEIPNAVAIPGIAALGK
jgi:hypothetical protein